MRWEALLDTPEPGDVALLAAMRGSGVVRRPVRGRIFAYLADRKGALEGLIRDHFLGRGEVRARAEEADRDRAVLVLGEYFAALAANEASDGRWADDEEALQALLASSDLRAAVLEAALAELRRPRR